ncbi:MAG: iron-sulfur cluster repair di-iron protein [Cyclobacteriaceae bacterium]|nr:iron-sulfur cluster repair di-iron protein [Cyclobacteriaceae bacterium]
MMENANNTSATDSLTVGGMVAEDYRKAEVFRKYGIDYCCGGNKSLDEVCNKKGLPVEDVQKELAAVENNPGNPSGDYNRWDLDFLSDYIVNTHHKYVAESLPMLHELSAKVARVHGENHPELVEMAKYVEALGQELSMHMHKEEAILFPYIREIAEAKRSGTTPQASPFGTVANPIQMMEREHDDAGDATKELEKLSNGFTPPVDACRSYTVYFAKLNEFVLDLHQHIHLENNILFPKALRLEQELLS